MEKPAITAVRWPDAGRRSRCTRASQSVILLERVLHKIYITEKEEKYTENEN
jgi:hypothetical protein